MLWVDATHTNIERVRRYAGLASGDARLGDALVEEALGPVVNELPFAGPENRLELFRRVDVLLRQQPPGHADIFADFGRWQFLTPLERRLVLLATLEGFLVPQTAYITGTDLVETRAAMKRARLKYADRFPLRIGLLGGNRADRDRVAPLLEARKFTVVWSVGPDCPVGGQTLPLPTAILVMGDQAGGAVSERADACALVRRALSQTCAGHLEREYDGPVLVAAPEQPAQRVNARMWTVPSDLMRHGRGLREMMVKALLFSD